MLISLYITYIEFYMYLLFVTVQLKMYEEMGFKVDHASPIYKSFRLKILGTLLFFCIVYFRVCLSQSRILIHYALTST